MLAIFGMQCVSKYTQLHEHKNTDLSSNIMCHQAHFLLSAVSLEYLLFPGSLWRPIAVPMVTNSPLTDQISSGLVFVKVK